VYFMLLLAVLVTICPSAFNKFGLVWYGIIIRIMTKAAKKRKKN